MDKAYDKKFTAVDGMNAKIFLKSMMEFTSTLQKFGISPERSDDEFNRVLERTADSQ